MGKKRAPCKPALSTHTLNVRFRERQLLLLGVGDAQLAGGLADAAYVVLDDAGGARH
jgi:hypothetical protein